MTKEGNSNPNSGLKCVSVWQFLRLGLVRIDLSRMDKLRGWDEQCEFVVHAYNSTVYASTGCSPNLLVFGEDLIMPADLVFGVAGLDTNIPCQVMSVEALRDQFKSAYMS